MKKIYLFITAFTYISGLSFAQQFAGSTNQTGSIFRAGTLGLGVTSVPVGIDLIVNNATNKSSKFVLGNNALFGTYTNGESVAQVYNLNSQKSRLSLVSASAPTNNLSLSLDINLTGTAGTGISLVASSSGNKKPFIFDMYGINSMIITPTGQVGIGTGIASLGTVKLAVEGTIGAREVKVTLSNPWPDYVFSDTYKRKSFEELNTFLKAEHHLPYLLSAEKVEAEGTQSLGETQQNMVRSLEELYLYVLDLKEENNNLKKELSALKNTINH